MIRTREDLSEKDEAIRQALCNASPKVAEAYELAQSFRQMVRQRRESELDGWLQRAAKSEIVELSNFATGLKRDDAAVRAALSQIWSNGQVEGQVNRLKMLKRQMYGRAKFDLLRIRVLARRRS